MKMKTFRAILLSAAAVVGLFAAVTTNAQVTGATVHGHVQNAAAQAITTGDVKFTKDRGPLKDAKFTAVAPIGASGDYAAKDIPPGDYVVYVVQAGDKPIDRQQIVLKAGDDKTLDFDMTREEYLKQMTPEERKAIEDFKKKTAEASAANKVVANLNATLKTVREDLNAASKNKDDVSKDVDSMKSATDAKPDEGLLWVSYGDTLQAQGDHLAKADRDAHKAPSTDDAVMQEYSQAADAYKKGIDLDAASKKPNPVTQAAGL